MTFSAVAGYLINLKIQYFDELENAVTTLMCIAQFPLFEDNSVYSSDVNEQ
jgi:hypothetical protein